jgi:hypothetical protein
MPWDLGLADGYETPDNTAVLPSPDKAGDHSWSEREWLRSHRLRLRYRSTRDY